MGLMTKAIKYSAIIGIGFVIGYRSNGCIEKKMHDAKALFHDNAGEYVAIDKDNNIEYGNKKIPMIFLDNSVQCGDTRYRINGIEEELVADMNVKKEILKSKIKQTVLDDVIDNPKNYQGEISRFFDKNMDKIGEYVPFDQLERYVIGKKINNAKKTIHDGINYILGDE